MLLDTWQFTNVKYVYVSLKFSENFYPNNERSEVERLILLYPHCDYTISIRPENFFGGKGFRVTLLLGRVLTSEQDTWNTWSPTPLFDRGRLPQQCDSLVTTFPSFPVGLQSNSVHRTCRPRRSSTFSCLPSRQKKKEKINLGDLPSSRRKCHTEGSGIESGTPSRFSMLLVVITKESTPQLTTRWWLHLWIYLTEIPVKRKLTKKQSVPVQKQNPFFLDFILYGTLLPYDIFV